MASSSREGKRSKVTTVAILLIVILGLAIFLGGSRGFFNIINRLVWLLIILGVLFLIGYVFWILFIKKEKIDVNYLNWKLIVRSAELSKPMILGDLHLMGDSEHTSVKLGQITGYTRVKNLATTEPEDVFVVKRASFPISLLEDPYVIRVAKKDHTALVGDVYLMGISLIQIGEFFYLNKVMDKPTIDLTHKQEAFRILAHGTIADVKGLMDIATGIDTEHKKKIEGTNMMQLPYGSQSQQSSGS